MSGKMYSKSSVKKRLMKGAFATAAFISVLLLSYVALERPMLLKREPRTIDELIEQVQLRGGTLVQCLHSQCFDLRTDEFVGSAQDGMYITYPEGTVSDDVIKKQAALVEKLFIAK